MVASMALPGFFPARLLQRYWGCLLSFGQMCCRSGVLPGESLHRHSCRWQWWWHSWMSFSLLGHHCGVPYPATQGFRDENPTQLVWVSDDGTTGITPSLEALSIETRIGLWQWRWWRRTCSASVALCWLSMGAACLVLTCRLQWWARCQLGRGEVLIAVLDI
jgi:hypothetical protein